MRKERHLAFSLSSQAYTHSRAALFRQAGLDNTVVRAMPDSLTTVNLTLSLWGCRIEGAYRGTRASINHTHLSYAPHSLPLTLLATLPAQSRSWCALT